MQADNTIIIITGPTAVGKTSFALSLAQHFQTEIISADSRQCYKEMCIGVARPSKTALAAVKHYFIASHSVAEDLNAGSFERYALDAAAEIFRKSRIAVMVGGTGLYIKAFCDGIDPMPVVPMEVRKSVTEGYSEKGLIWLQRELQEKDPQFWAVAEQQNPQRLMRALEVLYATGSSIMDFRTEKKAERPFHVVKIGLELPKETLQRNIDTRVDEMMEAGLPEEVRSLLPYRSHNALQTVGYRELFAHMDGDCSLEEAVVNIRTNTRHYAKRQLTWFKKDKEIQWVPASGDSLALVAGMA